MLQNPTKHETLKTRSMWWDQNNKIGHFITNEQGGQPSDSDPFTSCSNNGKVKVSVQLNFWKCRLIATRLTLFGDKKSKSDCQRSVFLANKSVINIGTKQTLQDSEIWKQRLWEHLPQKDLRKMLATIWDNKFINCYILWTPRGKKLPTGRHAHSFLFEPYSHFLSEEIHLHWKWGTFVFFWKPAWGFFRGSAALLFVWKFSPCAFVCGK